MQIDFIATKADSCSTSCPPGPQGLSLQTCFPASKLQSHLREDLSIARCRWRFEWQTWGVRPRCKMCSHSPCTIRNITGEARKNVSFCRRSQCFTEEVGRPWEDLIKRFPSTELGGPHIHAGETCFPKSRGLGGRSWPNLYGEADAFQHWCLWHFLGGEDINRPFCSRCVHVWLCLCVHTRICNATQVSREQYQTKQEQHKLSIYY